MASNYNEWYVQLFNRRTGRPIDDDTGLFLVLTASSPVRLTAYSDARGTSLTQPATMSNGVCRWFLDSATTSVDLTIMAAGGQSYFLEGLTLSQHRADVDPERSAYVFITEFNGNTACDAVADSGFDLLAGMRINDAWLHVTTLTTATGMDFGISGDTDGFADGPLTNATGYKVLDAITTAKATACAFMTLFVSSVQLRGILLGDFGAGVVTDSLLGGLGYFTKTPYMVTAATSLVYVVRETNSSGTGSGYIYLSYELVPTQGN